MILGPNHEIFICFVIILYFFLFLIGLFFSATEPCNLQQSFVSINRRRETKSITSHLGVTLSAVGWGEEIKVEAPVEEDDQPNPHQLYLY